MWPWRGFQGHFCKNHSAVPQGAILLRGGRGGAAEEHKHPPCTALSLGHHSHHHPSQHICQPPPPSLRRSCSPKTPQRWRNRRPRAAPIVHPQLPGTGFSITPLLAQEVLWGKKGTFGVGSGGWAHLRGHRSGDGAKRPPAAAPTAGRGTRRANCCPDRATSPRVLLPSCTAPSIGRAWDCSETPRGADGEGRWEDEALFSELHK